MAQEKSHWQSLKEKYEGLVEEKKVNLFNHLNSPTSGFRLSR